MTPRLFDDDIKIVGGDSARLLKRIARILNGPESAFLNDAEWKSSHADTIELLKICDELENAADRRKLLAFARSLVSNRRRV